MKKCKLEEPDSVDLPVKPKKVRTAPTNTSLLPPCKVCHEPAAGFHYGANTCEACKGFFRRSLLRNEPYRCLGSGNCNIRAGKRKICPKCRHLKCLTVGMSREGVCAAIKTGRYTHAKRTQDILEYHQMMGKTPNGSFPDIPSDTTTNSPETDSHNAPPSDHCSEICDSTQMLQLSPTVSTAMTSQSLDMLGSPSILDRPFQLSSQLSPSSIPSNVLASVDHFDNASPSSDETLLSTSSLSQTSGGDPSAVPSPDSSQVLERSSDLLSDAECEWIVDSVLRSHEETLGYVKVNLTPEKMLEKQIACYEACQLKMEMFGIERLSDEEYLDIYEKTGLDADNRQGLMNDIVPTLEHNIRRSVAFIKSIPGFSDLSLRDQIKLIRDNRAEFRMLTTYRGFNPKLKVATDIHGRTRCFHELSKMFGDEELEQRYRCAEVLQKLDLTREEDIILKCVIILSAGNTDMEEPDKQSFHQWRMAQCLLWLLKQKRQDQCRSFARMMSAVCQLRHLCNNFYKWLKTEPYKCYSQFQSSALLQEWFSDS